MELTDCSSNVPSCRRGMTLPALLKHLMACQQTAPDAFGVERTHRKRALVESISFGGRPMPRRRRGRFNPGGALGRLSSVCQLTRTVKVDRALRCSMLGRATKPL
jgi:hypothetical protein